MQGVQTVDMIKHVEILAALAAGEGHQSQASTRRCLLTFHPKPHRGLLKVGRGGGEGGFVG